MVRRGLFVVGGPDGDHGLGHFARETLSAQDIPVIRVLNKLDAVPEERRESRVFELEGVGCSAYTGEGLPALMERIERRLFREKSRQERERLEALEADPWDAARPDEDEEP